MKVHTMKKNEPPGSKQRLRRKGGEKKKESL